MMGSLFHLTASETVDLTPQLATQFSTMSASTTERDLSPKRLDYLKKAVLNGSNLPYWRERLAEAKGQSLRTLIRNTPDEEVSQPAIPTRHTIKPGPKPRDNQAEADILAHKNKTGEWPSPKVMVEREGGIDAQRSLSTQGCRVD